MKFGKTDADVIADLKQLKREVYGGIAIFLALSVFLGALYYWHQKDLNAWNTSKDIEVLVVGKHRGSGKGDSRRVYIKDGSIVVGVQTSARWYFETKIGQKAIVKYSAFYHTYRQPYHVAGREIYLFWYVLIPTLFILIRTIRLFAKIGATS